MSQGKQEATIIAENTGTGWIRTDRPINIIADFDIGTFIGIVTIQRRFIDKGIIGNIFDIDTLVSSAHKIADEFEGGVEYRLFVKTGDYTSGTAELRLSY